jgi:uncharacterized protein
MQIGRFVALGFALALLVFASAWAQDVAVPVLQARVTDTTGTLTASEQAALESKLAAFEQQKGSQVAVLIVPTTGDESIEQFGIRAVEQWKLGRKDVDDGVLLLVAKEDRRLRIEVGYGLEGALPDAIAKRIVADVITPYFRRGDFYTGISAGIDAILATVQGEPLPEPAKRTSSDEGGGAGMAALLIGIVAGFVIRAMSNRAVGGLSAAVIAGISAALLVGVAAALFYAIFALAVVVGAGGGGRGARRSAYWGGGFGGGGFGGGGFGGSGGGFGGGGGGFGGGGASGGW